MTPQFDTNRPVTMTVEQAAAYLGLARSTLNKWRCDGKNQGPRFSKMGRAVRYTKSELDRFIEETLTAGT